MQTFWQKNFYAVEQSFPKLFRTSLIINDLRILSTPESFPFCKTRLSPPVPLANNSVTRPTKQKAGHDVRAPPWKFSASRRDGIL